MQRSEQISVWAKPEDGPLIEYVCFRELDTGLYWVWGAHFVNASDLESPAKLAETRALQRMYTIEGLFDIDDSDPDELEARPRFENLQDAIDDFVQDF